MGSTATMQQNRSGADGTSVEALALELGLDRAELSPTTSAECLTSNSQSGSTLTQEQASMPKGTSHYLAAVR